MFIELNMMITFFYFQETYNNWLRERYRDDPSTRPEFDPDLWMEFGSSGGPDKNRVYGLSNTTADNLRTTRTASTIGSSQSVSSFQSKEFVALQQRCDHLLEAYTQLKEEQRLANEQHRAESKQQRAAYEELHQMVMNMTQGATCPPNPFWPPNPHPPPPPPPLY